MYKVTDIAVAVLGAVKTNLEYYLKNPDLSAFLIRDDGDEFSKQRMEGAILAFERAAGIAQLYSDFTELYISDASEKETAHD